MTNQIKSILKRQKEIAEKDARIAELELENKQAKEAIATLNDGKPLGEIVGLHTAQLQLIKIEALQAREKVLVELAKLTYGYLWHINAGLDAPAILNVTSITPENAHI